MKQEQGKRRSFLKHILTGSAVVAGVSLTQKKVQAGTSPEPRISDEILYQESEHFKKLYKSWRS